MKIELDAEFAYLAEDAEEWAAFTEAAGLEAMNACADDLARIARQRRESWAEGRNLPMY